MSGLGGGTPANFLLSSRKLTHYLLDRDHRQGGPKARFFLAFGFTAADHEGFGRALLNHAIPRNFVASVTGPARDERLIYEGPIASPDGRDPSVRTVWLRLRDGSARFITAVPLT